MKLIPVIGCLLVASVLGVTPVAAQNGSVRGVIYDSSTGLTIPGANIRVERNNKGATSNEIGFFQLIRLENKKQVLVVTVVGFQPDSLLIDLTAESFVEKNIFLNPKTYEVGEVTIQGFR
jgi:hypothetical protein